MTGAEIGLALVSGGIGSLLGGVGGAFGATTALRRDVADLKTMVNNRLTRVEMRVGVTAEGTLTGNGLIGTVAALAARVDRRNHFQHPDQDEG